MGRMTKEEKEKIMTAIDIMDEAKQRLLFAERLLHEVGIETVGSFKFRTVDDLVGVFDENAQTISGIKRIAKAFDEEVETVPHKGNPQERRFVAPSGIKFAELIF